MKHYQPRTCGYAKEKCIGISIESQSLSLASVLSCGNAIRNFYCLPTKFQGIVPSVKFINLSSVKSRFTNCTTSFQPFQQDGLFDASKVLQGYGHIPNYLQCYKSDSQQRPGILLPTPPVTAFQPVTGITIPTTITTTVSKIQRLASQINRGIKSGCSVGFQIINQHRTGANEFQCYVTDGDVYVTYPGGSQLVQVEGCQVTAKNQTAIYVLIEQSIEDDEVVFNGQIIYDYTEQQLASLMQSSSNWLLQLATVRIQSAIIDINQPLCSPIQLSIDWVRPTPDDQTYVWVWKAGKDAPQWVAVADCDDDS